MSATRETLKRLLVALILALLGVVLYSRLVPAETAAVREQLLGFPDSDAMAHWARPVILGGLCFLPAIAALLYASGGTLARYMAREFLGILAICFAALFLVWLLQDLENNLSDLRESKHLMGAILKFYGRNSRSLFGNCFPTRCSFHCCSASANFQKAGKSWP